MDSIWDRIDSYYVRLQTVTSKLEIDILCLPETNTNQNNNKTRTLYNGIINDKWKVASTYNSESIISWLSPYKSGGTHVIIHSTLKSKEKNMKKMQKKWGDVHEQ